MSSVLLIDPKDIALVGAWPARPSSPEEIATRLSGLLQVIGAMEPTITGWKRSRPKAVVTADDVPGLAAMVRAGAIKDSQRPPVHIKEAGYLQYFYPVGGASGLRVVISAGQTSEIATSTCTVYPPHRSSTLRTAAAALQLMQFLVAAFNPAWATWTRKPLSDDEHSTPDGRTLGYLNYGPTATMRQLDPAAVDFHRGAIATIGDDPELEDPTVVLARLPEPPVEILVPVGRVVEQTGWPMDVRFHIDDGIEVQLLDESDYRVWAAAHGAGTEMPTWDEQQTARVAEQLGVQDSAARIEALRQRGLLARITVTTEDVPAFCRRHRVEPQHQLLGDNPEIRGTVLIGLPDLPGCAVTELTASIFARSAQCPTLWAACATLEGPYPELPTDLAQAGADHFFLELHALLLSGAAAVLRVA